MSVPEKKKRRYSERAYPTPDPRDQERARTMLDTPKFHGDARLLAIALGVSESSARKYLWDEHPSFSKNTLWKITDGLTRLFREAQGRAELWAQIPDAIRAPGNGPAYDPDFERVLAAHMPPQPALPLPLPPEPNPNDPQYQFGYQAGHGNGYDQGTHETLMGLNGTLDEGLTADVLERLAELESALHTLADQVRRQLAQKGVGSE